MATHTINILKPSVNNLTVRTFVRAAGLEFEEVDVWGSTTSPEYLEKYPAHLTPMLETEGLPRGTLGESCAIMAYLCNKHGLTQFYPSDPGERAMVDNAMFYLIGTLYPLITRATYPTLGFPQYPGEVGTSEADDAMKAKAAKDAEAALAEPLDVYRAFFLDGKNFIGGDSPSIADFRLAASLEFLRCDRLRIPDLGRGVHDADGGDPRRRVHRAGAGRAGLHRLREVAERLTPLNWLPGVSPRDAIELSADRRSAHARAGRVPRERRALACVERLCRLVCPSPRSGGPDASVAVCGLRRSRSRPRRSFVWRW